MSYEATCYCPKCRFMWWELVHDDETFTCPKCGHKNIEPEELDTDLDMDEEEIIAIIKHLEKRHSKNLD